MSSTFPSSDKWPMVLTDQRGATAYAWFPPGTRTTPEHVLPWGVYAEVCRLAGVAPWSPWVAFKDRSAAHAALIAAGLAAAAVRG